MLTDKFKEAVIAQNVDRVKFMMKNSLTMDLTFNQFREMLDYASSRIPGLIEIHDGTNLEQDKTKWNKDYASELKVDLMDNFSSERIAHIKEVQRYVYADKVDEAEKRAKITSASPRTKPNSNTYTQGPNNSPTTSSENDNSIMISLIISLGVAAASVLLGVIKDATITTIATGTVIASCVVGGITYYLVKKS